MKLKMLEWFENLQRMNDEQIKHFAKKQGLPLTLEEVKKLRKALKGASISWGIYGVPKDVLQNIQSILGESRFQKLKKISGI